LRVGFGYDCHRFDPGRSLVLGQVRIEGHPGLAGHSDADVVLHAVTDAILGALAAGDIGEMFPDDDEQWRDVDSGLLVTQVVDLAGERDRRLVNCDVTVLAETPKLQPYKSMMRRNIAALLRIAPDAVSVKAKTNEGMGFIGRGEGIAAFAVVTVAHEETG